MKSELIAKIESRTAAIANLIGINERRQKSLTVLIGQITAHEVGMSECDGATEGKQRWLKWAEGRLEALKYQSRESEKAIETNERIIARHSSDINGFTRELDAITAEEARATEQVVTQTIAAINGRRVGKNPTRRYVAKGTAKPKPEDKPKSAKGKKQRGQKHGRQQKAA